MAQRKLNLLPATGDESRVRASERERERVVTGLTPVYVSIRQHMSAYVSIRQHMSAYVSIRQHMSAYVSIRQHTSSSRASESSHRTKPTYVSSTELKHATALAKPPAFYTCSSSREQSQN
jgi:hypothetical protein